MGALPDPEADEADPPRTFRGLDIFCGTGSLGLEALSRGVDHCTFVDLDRDAVDRLKTNLTDLQLTDRARVVKASALNPIWMAQIAPASIHLIFLDPPYALAEDEKGAQDLARLMTDLAKVAAADCLLSYRTPTGATPPTADGWEGPTSHAYGSMTLHFYERRMVAP
jgi:16S rRNA (guanine966-N2)-methyltransferase